MKNLWILLLLSSFNLIAQNAMIKGKVSNKVSKEVLSNTSVLFNEHNNLQETCHEGRFAFENLEDGVYQLTFFLEGYTTVNKIVEIKNQQDVFLDISLEALSLDIATVEVNANAEYSHEVRQLRNVEGLAIYAGKKSEVIELGNLTGNLATNNPRQVYKGVAGLNIWESDGAGLQLSIGARGLDPNRTSNFNTRQNGYDISADALGYPESYYTPPTQALKRIEIVRGAASLQYGPQFGGLLNFVFKKGDEKKPIELVFENTVGSFGLLSSFNSLGGTYKGLNYYTFYQRKQGNGWRPNSAFHQNTAFVNINKRISKKIKVGLEYTFMNYLSQQAGGLLDFEFDQDPRQSKRARNWFKVNWNLAALNIDYKLSDKTKINSRSFFLLAERSALGDLSPINRPDALRERDLIQGQYKNFGNETRLISRYDIKDQLATFLIGVRYYQGHTQNNQGLGTDGADADFTFLNPDDLETASYQFPSRNISIFAENLFNITPRWTITPGARFEYIYTSSEGFYKERFISGDDVLFEQRLEDSKENSRSFVLLGLGIGHKINEKIETYSNFSQNYRSINFSDLTVVNPNLVIDSLLKDEEGFNSDLGLRGTIFKDAIRFDVSTFFLQYQDRIGTGEVVIEDPLMGERAVPLRTNIGDARILGLETYIETDLSRLFFKDSKDFRLSWFTNISLLHGKYTSGQSFFIGKNVELVPPINFKTGLNIKYKTFKMAYQYAYVHQHFTDATNAPFVSNATLGLIPSYSVQDLSFSYTFQRFKLQTGINNLTNAHYFTRRATAYPGPGIIPADGRNFYVTFGVKF